MKITKRDIKVFFLGFLAAIIIDFAWNWDERMKEGKEAWKEGYEAAKEDAEN